jgi:phospholipid N-methyltransferase
MLTRDSRAFLRGMKRNPGAVGAVAPSSPGLAKRMLEGIDFTQGGAILELGPGTGPITREIAARIASPSQYIGIERDAHFAQLLAVRYPQLRFIHGSAEDAKKFLHDAGVTDLRAIISGLPFASLPHAVQDRIIEELDSLLVPGVVFRTFQYFHALGLPRAMRFRRQMRLRFGHGKMSRPILLNVPPAVVLSWER